MASAVMNGRNEANWPSTSHQQPPIGRKGSNLMGKFSYNTNPNPNPRKQLPHQNGNGYVHSAMGMSNRGAEFSHYVKFDVSGYSKAEMRKLKAQLQSELEKVRTLSTRIESGEVGINGNSKKRPGVGGLKESLPGAKRRQVEEERGYVAGEKMMKSCGKVLNKLMRVKRAEVFNSPVDVVGMGLYDYHTIVKRPMDLGTIKGKLSRNLYPTPEEFGADVRLTFNNAMMYNPKGHEVNVLAEKFSKLFEDWFYPVYQSFLAEKHQHLELVQARKQQQAQQVPRGEFRPVAMREEEVVEVFDDEVQASSEPPPKIVSPPPKKPSPKPAPVSRPEPEAAPVPVVEEVAGEERERGRGRKRGGRLPKPKAKDVNKREMSMEEKHKLGAGLQNLPEAKMAHVIQIIRKHNGDLTQDGDEIELDMEALDTETLWELDRFVTNYEKAVSKIRRQALMDMQNNPNAGSNQNVGSASDDTTTTTNNNQVDESDQVVETTPKAKKGGDIVVEEDVDIEDETPVNDFPPVEIDKDEDRQHGGGGDSSSGTSGSSSSGSSSSSDSDSGSSSGSDSDVDDAQSRDNESKNVRH